MNISIRPLESDEPEQMAIVTGTTGTFTAPIATLRELSNNFQKVVEFVDAFEEQEHLYAMAILVPEDTGIDHTLWYIPVPEGKHGPRIKVAIDPPHAKRRGGTEATVPFDAPAVGPISVALEKQVRAFIELNKEALLWYWKIPDDVSTKEFLARLRPISSK